MRKPAYYGPSWPNTTSACSGHGKSATVTRSLSDSAAGSAITSLQTLTGVDGVPKFLLYSKQFSEVDQTTETADGPISGL